MTDFATTRALFELPEGVIYLGGNSLGPLPKAVSDRVAACVSQEWGAQLIKGWNDAGWMAQPRLLGDRLARLIGAPPGSVVLGDTLSIKVFQALSAGLALRPGRKVILSDTGNFPSDLYMAQSLVELKAQGFELRLVDPEDVADALDESVAVLMLTEVDYRTGRRHAMADLTARAHAVGALAVWDLAHSAGALPVDLIGAGADFAVGCTYKYINAGPGAPALIYVSPKYQDVAAPSLAGWLGHDAPFAFEQDYRAGKGIERMRVGTPPVLQMAALEAALDVWEGVDMEAVRERSIALSERFLDRVEGEDLPLPLASPRAAAARGSQVSFAFAEDGYAVIQALIARGVIGDFRAPNLLRFGFTPLYQSFKDIDRAVDILAEILRNRLWDRDAFRARKGVT